MQLSSLEKENLISSPEGIGIMRTQVLDSVVQVELTPSNHLKMYSTLILECIILSVEKENLIFFGEQYVIYIWNA